jgi:hypothetical protein
MAQRSPALAEVNPLARSTPLRGAVGLTSAVRQAGGVVFHPSRNRNESTMLRIDPVCLAMVRDIRPCADRIARFDRDLARQLRKSSSAVPLNVAEGSGLRAGRRRLSYDYARWAERARRWPIWKRPKRSASCRASRPVYVNGSTTSWHARQPGALIPTA